jgi:hypothetical protein
MFVNIMAIEGYRTESEILSDAEMSNHVHVNAFTRVPMVFAARTRMAYTKYFNRKYGRKGRMGEKGTYVLKVNGFNHQLVLSNYILRNGLHHCAAATAFGYPFSSVHELFAEDLGWALVPAVFTKREDIAGFLPRFADFPDSYQMDGKGVFLRRSFMEIRRVEQYYASPRNFLFQMNRLTDETWMEEQKKDGTGKPLTLADIEPGLDEKAIAQLLNNEHGETLVEPVYRIWTFAGSSTGNCFPVMGCLLSISCPPAREPDCRHAAERVPSSGEADSTVPGTIAHPAFTENGLAGRWVC